MLFFLVLFTFTIIFPVTTVASVINDDNEFFGVFPEDYYDPRDYGEEIFFSEQFDEETSMNDNDNNNLLSTVTDNYIK